ncbi:MAG TPA: MFS transporter [Acidimicrobiales bacterium]|nr:MFS transporter [Acidimicrobiales bacterium]
MPRLLADVGPLKRHPHFRRLWFGQMVSSTGSQLTIVGVAYQAFRLTHSTAMVGLVSAGQLVPLLVSSLGLASVGDVKDRRRVLLVTQMGLALASAGLAVNAAFPHPALWPLFVCTAASAAFQGVDWPTRNAALRMIVTDEDLPSALGLQLMLTQWAMVAGPALAGLLVAHVGLSVVFGIDVATFGAALAAVVLLPPLMPAAGATRPGLRSTIEGLRYLKGERFLASTFLIDIDAMVFGMPRAVFPALGTGMFGGGAGTVGLLYAAPGAGALVGSMFTGWIGGIRRQGRALVLCVIAWGASIAVFGVVPVLWIGLGLLAVAGAADVVGAVFRNAILQATVPDRLRARLSGAFFGTAAGGPRIGDLEAGGAAALGGPQFAVWSGGVACVLGVGVLVWRVPELWRTKTDRTLPSAGQTEAIIEATAELGEAEPA